MRIIKDQKIVEDTWVYLADDAELPASGDVIVSTQRLHRDSAALFARSGAVGVRLKSDELPDVIGPDLARLALVAVDFPKFGDGRGYTTGRLLRERYNFKGELRAIGNVLRDQIFYMHRCGFNAFELTPGKSLESALEAFGEFSVSYQAAADDPRPLYRRRAI
ncbi:MAG: DUF934 domain-containing protein [Polyangiaceae bacterium]|nr:DUF934 domain-containing protein [Polyangiaceae bacterium]